MSDEVTCPHCGEVTHIGGLIGPTTDDCPKCGGKVLGRKRFKVTAVYSQYCEAIIEADSEDEAHEIARDMDGGMFDHKEDAGDWRIYDVTEIDE
jgi:predicted RNA-binding Zn-ribbon protein involved in translation (DUF1610 family)